MKLGDKILELRKKQGLSQEELGEKIDVTRQTISNWELGETSPNPEQLKLLSKELNISIDELLDNDIKSVLEEKVSNTEKLSTTILTILRFFLLMIIIGIIILSFYIIMHIFNKPDTGRELKKYIYCNIYGEQHSLEVGYQEYTGKIIGSGGDSYFIDILDLNKYDDVNQTLNIKNDYVKKNGGNCMIVDDNDFTDLVDFTIKEGTLTKTSATIILKPLNDETDFMVGESFWIEKYDKNSNSFQILENSTGNKCTYNMIAYPLSINKPLELKQEWSCEHGELEKGAYRLVKYMSFEHDNISFNKFYIWVEFEIVD